MNAGFIGGHGIGSILAQMHQPPWPMGSSCGDLPLSTLTGSKIRPVWTK
jgi:hypothetical protein